MRRVETAHDRLWLAACAVILLGGFALRLWNLGTQSLWHDEAWSVFSAYSPFAPQGIRGSDPNAPFGFYLSLGLWLRLAGDAVWTLRYWSLLIGLITVAVAGLLARRWFGGWPGALAALFVAASPVLWLFSQEIRAYVAMPLLALLLLALSDALLGPGGAPLRRSAWLALLVVELLALYTHNLSVPLVAWLNVTVLAALTIRRAWRRLALWLAGQALLLALYLPWLLTQQQTGTPLNTPPTLRPALLWEIWQSYFTGIKAMVGADGTLMLLTGGFGILAAAAVIRLLLCCRTRQTWLVLSQAALLPIFQLGIVLAAHIDFHPRYFIVGVPATLLLAAAGLGAPSRLSVSATATQFIPIRNLISNLRPIGAGLAAALAIAIVGWAATLMYSSPVYQHDDFRAVAERYARLGPDDVIVIPYGWEPALDYYSQRMHFQAKFVEIPLHSSGEVIIDRLLSALRGARRAELLTWYQLPADVRGAFPCVLGALGSLTDTLTVSGLKTDTYTLAATEGELLQAAQDSLALEAGMLRLTGRELLSAPGEGKVSACLVTRWQLNEPAAEDWRLSFRAHAPDGWEVLQADAGLLNDRQLPTSFWGAGEAGLAFVQLRWPQEAGGAYYPLMAHLYSEHSYHNGAIIGVLNAAGAALTLADYTLAAVPRQFTLPDLPLSARAGIDFPSVGMLIGASVDPGVSSDADPDVTLLWRASATPELAYTVFIHLRDSEGNIIAQSDTEPVNGVRPTTSWLDGEYIVDRHTLRWNRTGYRGPATLAVGLYDRATGKRVLLSDGSEFVVLPMSVMVQ